MTPGGRLAALAAIALAAAAAKTPSEAERIQALPEEDRAWLTEYVAPIILPEERKIFLDLKVPYERQAFKGDFWDRRERDGLAPPLGPGYRVRYAMLRRLADEKYDGWRQDAGRTVIRWGEPAAILSPKCADEDVFYDLEVWTYVARGAAEMTTERFIFYRPAHLGARKLWSVADEFDDPATARSRIPTVRVLQFEPPFQPNTCYRRMRDLHVNCDASGSAECAPCPDLCAVYQAYLEIRTRQGSRIGAQTEQASLFDPAKISTEGLERERKQWAVESNPSAKPIGVEGVSAAAVTVAPGSSTATPTPNPTPMVEPPRMLTDEEIRERILELEPQYKKFLDMAGPLLSREELSRFLQMSSKDKDKFIREFWKTRK